MKNKRYEKMIASSKRAAKKAKKSLNWDSKRGIFVYHLYDDQPKLSWWDDVKFQKGSQMVCVFWQHPRYKYESMCKDIAREMIGENPNKEDWLSNMTPKYKFLGKNKKRKKISSYLSSGFSPEERAWFDLWAKKQDEVALTTEKRIKPSIKIEIGSYARFVDVCIPMEIYSADQLKDLADFVNKYLDDRTLFEKTYGEYSYGKDEYMEDQKRLKEFEQNSLDKSHGVKM